MNQSRKKLLIRVIGAPLLLAALGSILLFDHTMGVWFDGPAFGLIGLLTVVAFLSAREFYGLCSLKGIETASMVGALAAASMFMPWGGFLKLVYLRGLVSSAGFIRLWMPTLLVLYVLIKLVVQYGKFTVEGAALTLAGYFYVGMLWMVLGPENGETLILYLLFLVATNKGSDMAAFVVGKMFGRRKLAPKISPNKTWEGAWGGLIGGTAAGTAVLLLTKLRGDFDTVPGWILPYFALLVTIAAQFGDLVESAIKRWAGAKDSGKFLPEFGGILDMVDSFLISVPVAGFARLVMMWLYPK